MVALPKRVCSPGWIDKRTPFQQQVNGGQTTVALHGGPIRATPAERSRFAENFESMAQGFGGTFAQLEAYLLLKK